MPDESSHKTYPKRRRIEINNVQSNQDVCSVCFGVYKDYINTVTWLVLDGCDWIQFTEEDCAAWSHIKCLQEQHGGYVCAVCHVVIKTTTPGSLQTIANMIFQFIH